MLHDCLAWRIGPGSATTPGSAAGAARTIGTRESRAEVRNFILIRGNSVKLVTDTEERDLDLVESFGAEI